MRKIIIACLGLLFLPAFAFAAFNDVTLTTSANISVGGHTLNITGSNAVISSIVVNASNFSVTLSSGSSIQVTSPTYQQLSVDVAMFTTSNDCAANMSVLTLASSGTSGTVTVTPQAVVCSTVPAPAVVQPSGAGPTAISGTTAVPWQLLPQTPQPQTTVQQQGGIIGSGLVIRNLASQGRTSSEIKIIQQLLNSDPATKVAKTGAGSPGQETTLYGPATRVAVQKFQLKYRIVKNSRETGYGVVGPKTKAKMNELLGKK